MKWVVSFAAALGLTACGIEYELKGVPVEEPPAPTDRQDCVSLESALIATAEGLGDPAWQDEAICLLHPGGALNIGSPTTTIRPGTAMIERISVVGNDLEHAPPSDALIRTVGLLESLGYFNHLDPDNVSTPSSNPDTTYPTAGVWDLEWTGGDLSDVNSCWPNCFVKPIIEIIDPDLQDYISGAAATPAPWTSAEDYCEGYANGFSEVCFDWVEEGNRRRTSSASTCVPGSGEFRLIPWRVVDNDHDDDPAVILKAVQTSGTGSLTGAAWISTVAAVQDQGEPLRVLHVNSPYKLDGSDRLVNASSISSVVPPQGIAFSAGTVSGAPHFILEEVLSGTPGDFLVDIQWTCGSVGPEESVSLDQGYVLKLSDLGCIGSPPQMFTLRPSPEATPTWVDIQVYGEVFDAIRLPLSDTPTGRAFSYVWHHLEVEGELQTHDPSTGATVRLDKLTWKGVNVCVSGTYFAPPEN